jgi:hypothetical protein
MVSGTANGAPGTMTVRGQAPMSELLGYQSRLNALTSGQGRYTIEFSHYESVPDRNTQQPDRRAKDLKVRDDDYAMASRSSSTVRTATWRGGQSARRGAQGLQAGARGSKPRQPRAAGPRSSASSSGLRARRWAASRPDGSATFRSCMHCAGPYKFLVAIGRCVPVGPGVALPRLSARHPGVRGPGGARAEAGHARSCCCRRFGVDVGKPMLGGASCGRA